MRIGILIISTLMMVSGAGCTTTQSASETSRQAGDNDMSPKKRVIILCTGNSCRSQMAEAFWRQYGDGKWEVVSAGTHPSGRVYPLAIQAMAEKSIDISKQQSKSIDPFLNQHFDLVITVCSDADENCPHFPNGGKYLHRGFDDPPKAPGSEEDRMRVTRRVRDEIDMQVREWINANS
ncbi:MAG: arsenate reductase ArsC [Phycisphaerae bacterium]